MKEYDFKLRYDKVVELNKLGTPGSARMIKLQEEQGELADALDLGSDLNEMVAETVDVLLMLLSINADVAESPRLSASAFDIWANAVFRATQSQMASPNLNFSPLELYIKLCRDIGLLAESYQIHAEVKSSQYKADKQIVLFSSLSLAIDHTLQIAAVLITHNQLDPQLFQILYDQKMVKWEGVSK